MNIIFHTVCFCVVWILNCICHMHHQILCVSYKGCLNCRGLEKRFFLLLHLDLNGNHDSESFKAILNEVLSSFLLWAAIIESILRGMIIVYYSNWVWKRPLNLLSHFCMQRITLWIHINRSWQENLRCRFLHHFS